ncbi:MAG: hypothetical protein AAFN78_02650 [Pseudomonadota bacterium]
MPETSRRTQRARRALLTLAAAFFVSACGGGSGGAESTTEPVSAANPSPPPAPDPATDPAPDPDPPMDPAPQPDPDPAPEPDPPPVIDPGPPPAPDPVPDPAPAPDPTPDPEPEPEPDPEPVVAVDFSFCDEQIRIERGTVCVIKPSKTDAAILDEHPESDTNPHTEPDTGEGYGYHVVAYPDEPAPEAPLYVHFNGTYTRPFDQNGRGLLADANGLHATVQLEEAVAAGVIAVQLAYANRDPVNLVCGQNRRVDNCAELIRREKLFGEELSDLADVDVANSINYRLIALLAYLEANLPEEALTASSASVSPDGIFDWSTIRMGGHSQGAGHAFYIAKNFGTQHACLLAGPFDVPDSVCGAFGFGCDREIADWYQVDAAPGVYSLTPPDDIRGLTVEGDPINDAVGRAYDLLPITENEHWVRLVTGELTDRTGDPINAHAAAAKADEFSAVRAKLCHTDEFLEAGEFEGL